MTHTLHRVGEKEDLEDDFTVLCMPAYGYNDENSSSKMKRFLEIAIDCGAVNYGDILTGSRFTVDSQGEVPGEVQDNSIVHAVFSSQRELGDFINSLVAADLGLSVVVQGLLEEIKGVLAEAGLEVHTVNSSLGIWGGSSALGDEDALRITTMCGHGLVSTELVSELVGDIAKGNITAKEAAETCAAQCVCGVFNPRRAERIFVELAAAVKGD